MGVEGDGDGDKMNVRTTHSSSGRWGEIAVENQPSPIADRAPVSQPAAAEHFIFGHTQKIQQRGGESSEELHERLRPEAIASFQTVRKPTQIDTPSWYTFDASKLLGIENAVAIVTSTCKHETPYRVFVGIRKDGWDSPGKLLSGEQGHKYKLQDLGRELSEAEKNAIYDRM